MTRTVNWYRSNVHEQCWVWKNEGVEYFYDKNEWVRVRVEQEHWHDLSPVAPSERESASALERKSPYSITVSHIILQSLLWLISLGIDDAVSPWARCVVVIPRVYGLSDLSEGSFILIDTP